jgi:hypothetical protein
MSITRTHTTSVSSFLTGKKRTVFYAVWGLAVLALLAVGIYLMPIYLAYFNGAFAPIEGQWTPDGTHIIAIVADSAQANGIQNGDVLLGRDGQAFAPQSLYPRSRQVLIFGEAQSTTTLWVQTGDAPPREVTVRLTQHADSLLAELVRWGIMPDTAQALRLGYEIVWLLIFWVMAFFLLAQRPDELMVLMGSLAFMCIGIRYGVLEQIRWIPQYQDTLQLLAAVFTLFIYLTWLLFPSGQLIPRWASLGLIVATVALYSNRFLNIVPMFNRDTFLVLDALLLAFNASIHLYRFRYVYTPLQKQQVKWLFLGSIVSFVGYYLLIVIPYLLRFEANLFLREMLRFGVLSIPIATLFAMLRYRLYDADYFLNRSLVYGATTGLLLVLFLLLTLLLRPVLEVLGVSPWLADSILLVVAVGLGLVFGRVRKNLQSQIDRRFFRLRLDLDELEQNAQRATRSKTGKLDGTTFETYRIEKLIGRGGMGEVYKAWRGSQAVAIKVLLERENSGIGLARFLREQELLAKTQHRNVVHYLDSGTINGMPYLTMEYLHGTDLGEYLKTQRRLPLEQALLILSDVANALHYLHNLGLVHRDVKPSNIMVQDTRAVLTDFGLLRAVHPEKPITQNGIVGTIQYTAPEQMLDTFETDHRADIYALGIVTYQMLAGELPFKGNVAQLVFAQLHEPPPSLRASHPHISINASNAVMKAMAKDPYARFNSVLDFVAQLRE